MNVKKSISVSLASSAVLASLLIGSVAFADTATPQGGQPGGWGGRGHMMGRGPGVFGTVASISGTSITVTSKGFGQSATETTYTVDASNATVTKDGAASSVSAIAVGDTVGIQGTVSGTSVTATAIHDGVPPKGARPGDREELAVPGNGQPIVGGSVTGVSGNTLTVKTAQGDVTYTVDASGATVRKDNATSSVSAIVSGDRVIVQGTVNGTSVTASSVIDQGAAPASNGTGTESRGPGGFFGMIGGLFRHLFGFF